MKKIIAVCLAVIMIACSGNFIFSSEAKTLNNPQIAMMVTIPAG